MGRCRVQLYPTEIILPVWFKTSFWSFQTMLNFSLFCKWEVHLLFYCAQLLSITKIVWC